MAKPIKVRKKWRINPKTRVKKSKKLYSRKMSKKKILLAQELELERYL